MQIVVVVLSLCVMATGVTVYMSFADPAVRCPVHGCGVGEQQAWTVIATLCQTGNLAWLLHFRCQR